MNNVPVLAAHSQPLKEDVEARAFLYRCEREGTCEAHLFVSLERGVFRKSMMSILDFPLPALHSVRATGLVEEAPLLEPKSCIARHPEVQFASNSANPAYTGAARLREAFPGEMSIQLLVSEDGKHVEAVLGIGEHCLKGSGEVSEGIFQSPPVHSLAP
ncbi:MAG: hypothetical protein ABI747_03165 [Candidatus Moraniibacteriota bacterium]